MSEKIGQLREKIFIKGYIKTLTGLHIGGSNPGFAIGGADATVVRNPLTMEPYIPGSSLKGKMRSLLERLEGKWSDGKMKELKAGPYYDNINDPICQIFGLTPEKLKDINVPVTRIIVRDCALTRESEKQLIKLKSTDMPYTEVKTEVVIDRITASATPRQLERVPAGAIFEMRIILNIHHKDDTNLMLAKVLQSLCLVQNDALGGKGSRGSGEVKITIENIYRKDKEDYEANRSWQSATDLVAKIPSELQYQQATA
jgi:CRISPR-associated protein Csm3